MRNPILFAFLAICASAFGQSAPDKTVEDLAKKRIAGLDLFAGPKGRPTMAFAKPAAVCAIPLLVVRPSGNYKMPVIKPPMGADSSSRELHLQVPAPACDEKLFQNKSNK